MSKVDYFIEDTFVPKKKLVITNNSAEDKLLKVLNNQELIKIIMIGKSGNKEFYFDEKEIESIEVEEI